MKATINCGCDKCCDHTKIGELAPHRLKITRGRDGIYRARGHNATCEEIEGAHTWEDIEAMYRGDAWRLEIND